MSALGAEKRSARRIPIACPLRLELPGGERYLGMALDLSVDGIAFECARALAPAANAEIELLPPAGSAITPMRASIEVVRCAPLAAGYRIGAALRVRS